jgi:uncharacterized SAM-binding protein YcdF (DUF218 family)
LIAWAGARWLIVTDKLAPADAIIVLSGSSTFVERTQHAARLYADQVSDKVIITNDNRQGSWLSSEQRNPYFYERARWELMRLGVPADRIEILQTPVYSTWDEAVLAEQYCEAHGLRSLLIVTSGYHSRRALWTFQNQFRDKGIQVGVDPVSPGFQTPPPKTWWLHLRGWQTVFGEYLKLIYYRVRNS